MVEGPAKQRRTGLAASVRHTRASPTQALHTAGVPPSNLWTGEGAVGAADKQIGEKQKAKERYGG